VTLAVLIVALAFATCYAAAELDGSWTVARATVNGAARAEGKLLNATWTFRGPQLLVQNENGERLRASLSFDSTVEPPAVHVVPIDDPQQRPLWMIWVRQGDELRVAFYDGVDARPVDFGPRPKLVVLKLVPARGASVTLDPCHILRAADVDRLLGGPTQRRSTPRAASAAGSTCAVDRTDGSRAISLTLVPAPAGAGYVDAARREAQESRRMQIEEEPGLGAGAFSSSKGWTVIVVAERRGAAIVLKLEGVAVDHARLRGFAARVLDSL
jgi:uncharacterized protein (TIGR03067 family)